ncbi:LysR family transcriptional regulator [Lactobacillus sp. ESL0785]|uniref:LysR family transcriptional regulator n=1 Tax=Lactobacillus sp. ESL0785 TaxID=2983232 RepID=UPI0023F79020|nr:LysR family transcriptional regulator [Lactobacillus sp. ESL0785]WEV71059.1 LysR family transcriptional regulator [Lactobacillus sp. ESL0785]
MNFTQLSCFITVVENASFTLTARKLNLSQSSVSKNIKDLEAELNILLLNRTTHGLDVTSAGRYFYQVARSILKEMEIAKNKINQQKDGIGSTFRVGLFSTPLEQKTIPLFLKELKKENSQIDIEFKVNYLDNIVSELSRHQIDACLVSNDIVDAIDGINFEPLIMGKFMVSCSKKSLPSVQHFLDYRDLRGSDKTIFLLETDSSLPVQQKMQNFLVEKIGSSRIKYVSDLFTMDSYVGAGWGLGVLPNFTANLSHKNISYIPFRYEECPEYGLAFMKTLSKSFNIAQIVRIFRQTTKKYLDENINLYW